MLVHVYAAWMYSRMPPIVGRKNALVLELLKVFWRCTFFLDACLAYHPTWMPAALQPARGAPSRIPPAARLLPSPGFGFRTRLTLSQLCGEEAQEHSSGGSFRGVTHCWGHLDLHITSKKGNIPSWPCPQFLPTFLTTFLCYVDGKFPLHFLLKNCALVSNTKELASTILFGRFMQFAGTLFFGGFVFWISLLPIFILRRFLIF